MKRLLAGALWALGLLPMPGLSHVYKPPFDLKAQDIVSSGQQLYNRNCAGRWHGLDGAEGLTVSARMF